MMERFGTIRASRPAGVSTSSPYLPERHRRRQEGPVEVMIIAARITVMVVAPEAYR